MIASNFRIKILVICTLLCTLGTKGLKYVFMFARHCGLPEGHQPPLLRLAVLQVTAKHGHAVQGRCRYRPGSQGTAAFYVYFIPIFFMYILFQYFLCIFYSNFFMYILFQYFLCIFYSNFFYVNFIQIFFMYILFQYLLNVNI